MDRVTANIFTLMADWTANKHVAWDSQQEAESCGQARQEAIYDAYKP